MCLWIAFFCCRRKAVVGPGDNPFSTSAVAKGLTHYTLPAKCVPTGCSAPLLETPRPIFLTAKGYPNHQKRFGTHAVNNRKSEKSPRRGLEKFRIFVHGSLLWIFKFPWRIYGGNAGEVADLRTVSFIACFLKCKR